MVAARSFARRLRESLAAAQATSANAPSAIGGLASKVAQALDDTTRRLGGAPPLAPAGDPVESVASSATSLISAIGTYDADDWNEDRGGVRAIVALREGISEAGAYVRQAEAMVGG